jgi:hypothetical protein
MCVWDVRISDIEFMPKHPVLKECELTHNSLQIVIDGINSFDFSGFVGQIIGKSQIEQKDVVGRLRDALADHLTKCTRYEFESEKTTSASNRDSFDILGAVNSIIVIIELDKTRADQVSKKFVSRTAEAKRSGKELFLISFCYGHTEGMNPSETYKYFSFCKTLAKEMKFSYASFVADCNAPTAFTKKTENR